MVTAGAYLSASLVLGILGGILALVGLITYWVVAWPVNQMLLVFAVMLLAAGIVLHQKGKRTPRTDLRSAAHGKEGRA